MSHRTKKRRNQRKKKLQHALFMLGPSYIPPEPPKNLTRNQITRFRRTAPTYDYENLIRKERNKSSQILNLSILQHVQSQHSNSQQPTQHQQQQEQHLSTQNTRHQDLQKHHIAPQLKQTQQLQQSQQQQQSEKLQQPKDQRVPKQSYMPGQPKQLQDLRISEQPQRPQDSQIPEQSQQSRKLENLLQRQQKQQMIQLQLLQRKQQLSEHSHKQEIQAKKHHSNSPDSKIQYPIKFDVKRQWKTQETKQSIEFYDCNGEKLTFAQNNSGNFDKGGGKRQESVLNCDSYPTDDDHHENRDNIDDKESEVIFVAYNRRVRRSSRLVRELKNLKS